MTEKIANEHELMDECPTAGSSAEIDPRVSKPSSSQNDPFFSKPTDSQSGPCVSKQSDSQTKDSESSDSNCESDDEYTCKPDLKRQRLLDQRLFDGSKYEELYPWLYFSMLKGGYLCKYCELFSLGKKLFTETGVILGDHPSRKLDKHSNTNRHLEATKKYAQVNSDALKKKKSVLLLLHESSKSQREEEQLRNREVFKKLFRITYFLIRKEWAQANYEDLVRFIATLGVADLQHHIDSADPSATYLSSTTETELIQIIGEVIERQLLDNLRNSNFFTLLADESTDEQNREQLSLFAKWIKRCNEMPTDHFLGIVHVEKTDSETLLNAIQHFLIAKNIDVTKCKFVGFDGTNAMSGEVSGLQRRMRHLSPMCLYINCRNHRLALCLKHLMKQYPLLVEADSLLLAIWKMFHYSPRKFEVFRNIQALYGENQMTLIRAATTRWLSHGKASIRLIEKYQPVLDTLDALYDERHEPEIFGLRCSLTDKSVIAMILVLCDVLKPVNILSLYLQSPTICFSKVETQVKVTINELEGLIALYQTHDNDTYFSKIESIFEEIADRTDLQRRLRANFNITPDEFLNTVATPFIYSLIGEISDAFHCHPVFKAFEALDPDNLPVTPADIIEHGKGKWKMPESNGSFQLSDEQ